MGSVLSAIYLQTRDRRRVRRTLEELTSQGCRFLLAPRIAGWIGVYPNNEGQDPEVLARIAAEVGGEALYVYAFNSDVFGYQFYRDGQTVDEFCSLPDYADDVTPQERERLRGNPELLADLLPAGRSIDELRTLLHPDDGHIPGIANFMLRDLAKVLGLPNALVSYDELTEEYAPTVWRIVSGVWHVATVRGYLRFRHIPSRRPEKRRRRQRTAQRSATIGQQLAAGTLLHYESVKGGWFSSSEPSVCPNGRGGFFIASEQDGLREWMGPGLGRELPFELGGAPERVFLSPLGRFLAVSARGEDGVLTVWDLEQSQRVFRTETCGTMRVDFSSDEQHLLELSHDDLRVFELASGKRLTRIKVGGGWSACFDPRGDIIVVADHEHLVAYDWRNRKRLRRWLLGEPQNWEVESNAVREAIAESFEDYGSEQAEQHLRRLGAYLNLPDSFAQGVAAEFEKARQEMLENLDSDEFEESGVARSENALQVAFHPNGQWLICGTNRGVRIYDWDGMLHRSTPISSGSEGETDRATPPPPLLSADSLPYREEGEEEFHDPDGDAQVHALVCDSAGDRVLFTGAGGVVHSLDLRNGQSQTLVEIPGRPTLHGLSLSRDGSVLACTTCPQICRDTPKVTPEVFVWDYKALFG